MTHDSDGHLKMIGMSVLSPSLNVNAVLVHRTALKQRRTAFEYPALATVHKTLSNRLSIADDLNHWVLFEMQTEK